MVTETIWEGHLSGLFEGYAYDRLFALSDGTKWRQACTTREYVYRERPAARLVREPSTGRVYLDVTGTSASVLVERNRGNDRRTWSAY